MTRGERMRALTSIASPSLVNSSVTVRRLELLPVGAMVEYVYDHTWFGPDGACGRGRAAATRLRGLARGNCRPARARAGRPGRRSCDAVAAEKDTDAAIAIARILRRQLLHPLDHARVLHRLAALVAQRRSRHREQRAGPSYRETTLPAIRN